MSILLWISVLIIGIGLANQKIKRRGPSGYGQTNYEGPESGSL